MRHPAKSHRSMRRVAVLLLASLLAVPAVAAGQTAPGKGPARAAPAPARTSQPRAKKRTFTVDRVIAVVNDAVLLSSELDIRLLPLLADVENIDDPSERRRRLDKLRAQMLEDMINEELIVQAALEARIEVPAADINSALEEIKKQNNLDDKQFAEALAAQGYTMAAYKNDMRRQLTRLSAVNQLVRSKVTVSEDALRVRYDAMVRRSESVNAVRLSHIRIDVPEKATDAVLAAAKERAAEAVTRVRNGEDFTAVAAELSDDEATKTGGGELGWFERGALSPEWEAVVFAMEKGEVRGPISGPQGLEVFYVTEVKRTEIKSFDELKEQIRAELTRREMDKQTQLWIDELRKKAYIDNKLT